MDPIFACNRAIDALGARERALSWEEWRREVRDDGFRMTYASLGASDWPDFTSTSHDDMDRVFYDRIVKGYALVDMPDEALAVFRRVVDSGSQIILGTQHELLLCLLRARRVGDASEVVNNTVAKYRELYGKDFRGPDHARFWKHAFWHTATREGLLDLSSLELPV